ncbi:hypothetical protein WMY93_032580 [Mugilogobius chulae]|uniref:Uncharacterized protein n=1 Tax=Mugilogobius chulae TaxID=88201 RepID=A0AAW0MKC3_9GOBI
MKLVTADLTGAAPVSDHVTGAAPVSDHVTGAAPVSDHVTGAAPVSDHVTGAAPVKIFGSSEDLSRYQQQLLSDISPDVLQDYGPDYISSLVHSLASMSQNVLQDVTPVLESMEHALLSARPKALYSPGQGAWLLPFLHRCLPTAAFDRIIRGLINDTCQPSALKN